jgi:S-phase kinase-associated protein 1
MESAPVNTITFKCADEEELSVSICNMLQLKTIKAMLHIDDDTPIEEIEVPEESIPVTVNKDILELIIKYIEYHNETTETEQQQNDWDSKFMKSLDDNTLFDIILAANYLDNEKLLDLSCKTVSNYIKQCKTPQEIRRRFNIKNDFTPEEEDQVRNENAWCEEK